MRKITKEDAKKIIYNRLEQCDVDDNIFLFKLIDDIFDSPIVDTCRYCVFRKENDFLSYCSAWNYSPLMWEEVDMNNYCHKFKRK